jgi:Tfp pilus assembly PilM family ATPase
MRQVEMFGFGKNQVYAIGVDLSGNGLRLAQLVHNGQQLSLMAGCWRDCPGQVEPGTAAWQHWVIDVLRDSIDKNGFRGKTVTAAMLPGEVFIETIKMPKATEDRVEDALFAKVKPQMSLRCSRENALIRYTLTDQDNALVMVADRELIHRHLAIYEKVGLTLKSMGAWPEALANCYVRFFGRRQSDLQTVVMLVNVEAACTNVVICRHTHLLFARSIPIGAHRLKEEAAFNGLVLEVTACRRDFVSLYRNVPLTRVIFMSGPSVETSVYAGIAKQLEVQAQIGDCMAAVEVPDPIRQGIDRRECPVSWATAFGLSLS